MVNCGACKHWKRRDEDFAEVVGYGGRDWNAAEVSEADRLYGHCEKIDMGPVDLEELPLATVMDGSQYRADLFTRAEFGCALGEAV